MSLSIREMLKLHDKYSFRIKELNSEIDYLTHLVYVKRDKNQWLMERLKWAENERVRLFIKLQELEVI